MRLHGECEAAEQSPPVVEIEEREHLRASQRELESAETPVAVGRRAAAAEGCARERAGSTTTSQSGGGGLTCRFKAWRRVQDLVLWFLQNNSHLVAPPFLRDIERKERPHPARAQFPRIRRRPRARRSPHYLRQGPAPSSKKPSLILHSFLGSAVRKRIWPADPAAEVCSCRGGR